jgi:hypothetical protein
MHPISDAPNPFWQRQQLFDHDIVDVPDRQIRRAHLPDLLAKNHLGVQLCDVVLPVGLGIEADPRDQRREPPAPTAASSTSKSSSDGPRTVATDSPP